MKKLNGPDFWCAEGLLVGLCTVRDYKFLYAAVTICAMLGDPKLDFCVLIHDIVDLLQLSTSSTRSATHRRLQVNHSHTAFGRRAFSHSSATVWSSPPSELTSNFDSVEVELNTFKRHLKTHLFKKHFNLYP